MPPNVPTCKPGFRHCWHPVNRGTPVEAKLCCWCGHTTDQAVPRTFGHAHGAHAIGSN